MNNRNEELGNEPILIAKFYLNKNVELFKESPKEGLKMNNAQDFKIPTMQTIDETAKLTGVAASFIRQLAKNKEIFCIQSGNKYLINFEKFIEFLNTSKGMTKTKSKTNKYDIEPINL